MVPAPRRGEESLEATSQRPATALRLRAPPSTRALRCRVRGLLRGLHAAVVEVEAAADEWHPAVSNLGASVSSSPTSASSPYLQTTESAADPESLQDSSASENLEGNSNGSHEAPPLVHGFPYQVAERALRLEQQTSTDPLYQEELLVQQQALVEKVLPQQRAKQLGALDKLFLQHPQLHAYQHHLHVYPEGSQEDAIGALALLPLQELATFVKIRKGMLRQC